MNVLLVHASAGMTSGDLNLESFIQGQGHAVFRRAANASEDLIGAQAVVVSESCASSDVTTKYSTLPVPALCLEPALWDDWNMAAAGSGGANASVTITNNDPRFNGSLTIAGSPYTTASGGIVALTTAAALPAGATQLADETTSGEPCYFYIPRGGSLVSGVASELRIGLGFQDGMFAAGISSDGQQMLFGALREVYKATMRPRGRVFFLPAPGLPNTPGYIRSNGGNLLAANNGRILRAA